MAEFIRPCALLFCRGPLRNVSIAKACAERHCFCISQSLLPTVVVVCLNFRQTTCTFLVENAQHYEKITVKTTEIFGVKRFPGAWGVG